MKLISDSIKEKKQSQDQAESNKDVDLALIDKKQAKALEERILLAIT